MTKYSIDFGARQVGQDGILRRVVNPPKRRLPTGAQLAKLPHILMLLATAAVASGQDPQPPVPPSPLTIRPGTFITVRVNEPLSSDRNQLGAAFSATLARPVVVDGVVVAQRGQTLGGRVAEARKAGRVEGVSRLGIQLTDLTLVDGQQLPIQSQLISRSGPTSVGRDASAIGGTTAMGAAIGAAANYGVGAGIGAAAGAAVGALGVVLTRGRATIIYPESVLTFRVEAPITFATDRAPQAFRFVDPNEYDRPEPGLRTSMASSPCGEFGCPPPAPPPPYVYGPPIYYPRYPYRPGISFFYGQGFYFGRGHRRW